MIKKVYLSFIVFTLCLFSFVSASAYMSDVVVSLEINNPVIEINGVETETDTAPVIKDGRTLMPIRAIIEAFGGTVTWNGETGTVGLSMMGDNISLTINNSTAFLNNKAHTLDVPPTIINERTMLPIRFVAEGFNLGVAWDEATKTVTVIRNLLDEAEYQYLVNSVPAYTGEPYVEINGNYPMFKDYEIISGSFEYYSSLDGLGRCDVCMASIAEDIMPKEDRGDISSVIPTGWKNATYDIVSGGYIYNRCHLIGFQLTGENANKRNLITGTRYMNVDGMLPFENMVDDYIDKTGNRVMYRTTPLFKGNNLVADGVLIEAYSVEDMGQGICFCVFCYNVQPGINIDYLTGVNILSEIIYEDKETAYSGIYRTPTGKRYHFDAECGGKNSYPVTLDEARGAGLTPCKKCTM